MNAQSPQLANDLTIDQAIEKKPLSSLLSHWATRSVSVWLFIGMIIFILWAALFEIDQSVSAQGKIIPGSRTQIIQVVDGGVLAELMVSEGQRVSAGETLAMLERERAQAGFEESQVKLISQKAGLIRAIAEINGVEPEYGDEFSGFEDFAEAQLSNYRQRKKSLEQSSQVLTQRLNIAQEVLRINEKLVAAGDTSQMEVLQSQREVAQLKGELIDINSTYYLQAQDDAVRLQTELASTTHQLEERRSVLSHTELTSPVTGVVKYLKVNTLGGVFRAGDELMQISPTDDDMFIEIKVNPADIGQLELNLPVSLALDAFDYSIYGTISGQLVYISSDTLTEKVADQEQTYYSVKVRIAPDAMAENPRFAEILLKPGMTVNASIRTGTRTVLRYLLKPIYRGFQGALSER
ncbi:MAG: adhesin transport system membrane fusion protein [Chitinophagales bacterium]|jgi:adhesin transport system membrane fusion protein